MKSVAEASPKDLAAPQASNSFSMKRVAEGLPDDLAEHRASSFSMARMAVALADERQARPSSDPFRMRFLAEALPEAPSSGALPVSAANVFGTSSLLEALHEIEVVSLDFVTE